MIQNYQAYVLSLNQYKSSSQIVTFLTNKSIIQAISHQSKKNSKAFGSDLETISKLQINIYEKKENTLSILKETSIIENYKVLEKSIYSSLAVFYIREVLMYSAKDFDDRYFILMDKVLNALSENEKENGELIVKYISIILRAFEIKVLHIAGLSPELKSCIMCGNKDIKEYYYAIIDGGILCEKCRALSKYFIKITNDDLNFMRIIKYSTLIEIATNKDLISYYNNSIYNVRDIMIKSINNHIHREIKSLKVLEDILFTI